MGASNFTGVATGRPLLAGAQWVKWGRLERQQQRAPTFMWDLLGFSSKIGGFLFFMFISYLAVLGFPCGIQDLVP